MGARISRRRFLGMALSGAGVATLGQRALGQADAPVGRDPFGMVDLGKSGLRVSLVGAGTGMSGFNRQSNMTRMGKEKFEALLQYAFERGVRLFDCADIYGTHPYLASALSAIPRDEYAISTKIWFHGGGIPEPERPDANIVIDRFRQELNTDYIDLALIHCVSSPTWPTDFAKQMDIMSELKAAGIIRAHGVSVHGLDALRACTTCDWLDSVHARINAYGDAMDDPTPSVVAEVLQELRAQGKGVVGMKLIGEGRYRDDPARRSESIRYVLDQACVDTMVVGFERPEEIDDFAERVSATSPPRIA